MVGGKFPHAIDFAFVGEFVGDGEDFIRSEWRGEANVAKRIVQSIFAGRESSRTLNPLVVKGWTEGGESCTQGGELA